MQEIEDCEFIAQVQTEALEVTKQSIEIKQQRQVMVIHIYITTLDYKIK
jgi:hypothetical protein